MSGQSDTLTKDEKRLAAQVHLTTKLPTLTLEDIDHHLSGVTCSGSLVTLSFATAPAKNDAVNDLAGGKIFYLITSHDTCNDDGERNVYMWVNE